MKGCYTCLQCTCSHTCSRKITLTHHQNEVANLYLFCGEKEKKYGGVLEADRVLIGTVGQTTDRQQDRDRQTDSKTETDRQTDRQKEVWRSSEGRQSSNRDSRTDKQMDGETEPDRQADR